MPTWSDILQWDHTGLSDTAASLSAARSTLAANADEAALAESSIASSGTTIDQARQTLKSLNSSHDDLVNEVSELMMATSEASDGVWDVETKVLECQLFVEMYPYLSIGTDGTVTYDIRHATVLEAGDYSKSTEINQDNINRYNNSVELQEMVDNAVARAVEVDDAYAKRLQALIDGTYTCSETSASTSPGLPDQPQEEWSTTEVATWWNSLTQEEKDAIIANNPEWIGNLDGVDMDSRDRANRNRVDDELEQARQDVAAAQARYDQWASEGHTNPRGEPLPNPYDDELRVAKERQADLEAIQSHVEENPDHGLLVLDTSGTERVRAAIGIGDVDTAEHVGTFVPGMATNPASGLEGYVDDVERIRKYANQQDSGTVATVAWLGYDAPPGVGDPGWTSVMSTDKAEAGADALNSFTEGINSSRAATGRAEPHQTVLGHSYGSTTSGIAVAVARKGVVDDLVMFGSPGSGVHDVHEYNLGTGQAHVSAVDSHDLVQGMGPDFSFGTNPTKLPGINHLSGETPEATGWSYLNPFGRHSTYLMEGSGALMDMSKVVAGREP